MEDEVPANDGESLGRLVEIAIGRSLLIVLICRIAPASVDCSWLCDYYRADIPSCSRIKDYLKDVMGGLQ